MDIKNHLPFGDIWPPVPWEGFGRPGPSGCSYRDITDMSRFCNRTVCFGLQKFAASLINGEAGGSGPRLTLDTRTVNMLVSILVSVIERKYIALTGADNCIWCKLPCGDLYFECGNYSPLRYYDCRAQSMKAARRNMYWFLREVVHDLAKEYADARTHERSFGSVFPDSPYPGTIPDWCQCKVFSLKCFVDYIVDCGDDYYADQYIWNDITQRMHYWCRGYCGRPKHQDMFGEIVGISPRTFETRGTGYRPALRYFLDQLKMISGCYCTIEKIWRSGGNPGYCDSWYCRPICSLPSEYDYVEQWASGIRSLYSCGFLSGSRCLSPERYRRLYDRIFGCDVNIRKRYNSFAVSLAMVLLNSFSRYQLTRQNVSIGDICHTCDEMCLAVDAVYTGDRWIIRKYRNDHQRRFSCHAAVHFAFGAYRVSPLCIVGKKWRGRMPYVMYECVYVDESHNLVFCGPVYCYYRCKCWDKPYCRWIEYPKCYLWEYHWRCHDYCDLIMHAGSLIGYRQQPVGYGLYCPECRPASRWHNYIHLCTPEENFPAVCSCQVRSRLSKLRNVAPVLKTFDGCPWGKGKSGFSVTWADWDCTPYGAWIEDTSFCIYNKSVCNINEHLQDRMRRELYFCDFENTEDSFTAKYFGFGDELCQQLINLLCGGVFYAGEIYDKITVCVVDPVCYVYNWHYWKWDCDCHKYYEVDPECRCEPTSIFPEKWTIFRDLGAGFPVWYPTENTREGTYGTWHTLEVRASVQFGGFFQINEWKFGALQ